MVIFIRFYYDIFSTAHHIVTAKIFHFSPNDDSWFQTCTFQNRTSHRSGSCFAMSSGNSDRKTHSGNFSQQFCSADNRYFHFVSRYNFRIVIIYSAGFYYYICIADVFGVMTFKNLYAEGFQMSCNIRFFKIGAGNF